jgi:AraC family transcriptional activator of pobA
MVTRFPSYGLYGENDAEKPEFWLHAESILARSRLHNWEIRPHRHAALFQILHIRNGRGEAFLEGVWTGLAAGSVVTVPARHDHGFRFSSDIDGVVITFMAARLSSVAAGTGRRQQWLTHPRLLQLDPTHPDTAYLGETLQRIERELAAGTAVHAGLVEALLATALLLLLRQPSATAADGGPATAAQRKFEQLQDLVNADFRSHRPIGAYAARLGVSATHLNRIARQVARTSVSQLISDRLITEAKRNLVLTGMSVQQVAENLGFADPAYFTRFFTRHTGLAPRHYRDRQQARLAADHV